MQCSLDRLIAPSFYKVHNSIEDYTHFLALRWSWVD